MPHSAWPSRRISACGMARSRAPVSGSTLTAAQRVMRFTTLSRASPIAERPVEQFEFVPGRPALDIEVGAEAQGMDRLADHVLDGADACEIDDRDDLAGDVREAVAAARRGFLAAP